MRELPIQDIHNFRVSAGKVDRCRPFLLGFLRSFFRSDCFLGYDHELKPRNKKVCLLWTVVFITTLYKFSKNVRV